MSEQWINKTEIKSESSNRIYVVSQHATKRHWACSCPAWRTKRACKHLVQLGLPNNEEPFEKAAKKKGFMDVYEGKTYDTTNGYGTSESWRQEFAKRIGIEDARAALGLSANAGWNEVRQAFQMAATESMTLLVGNFEAVATAFINNGDESQALEVRNAKFRLEAYSAYLEEQRIKLEAEMERVTDKLIASI